MKRLFLGLAVAMSLVFAPYAAAYVTTLLAHDEIVTVAVDGDNDGTYDTLYADAESLGYTSADYKMKFFVRPWSGWIIPEPGAEVMVHDTGSFKGLSPFNNVKTCTWTSNDDTNGKHPRGDFYSVNCVLYKWDPYGDPDPLWIKVDNYPRFIYPD